MAGKRKVHRNGELDALYFDKLPQRAKEIFFEFLSYSFKVDGDKSIIVDVIDFSYEFCESPIEIIFNFAYDLCLLSRKDGDIAYSLTQQAEIQLDKKYRVDFLFDTNEIELMVERNFNPLKLIIECDGHDFHSTKEQIKHDNERDMAFRKAGYEVIHFSGSQIYENPFKCANETIDYILSKI